MSILQNLKALNQPIAELAMLDQTTIMQMAQSGQIPAGYVAPILNEKARIDQAKANAAAMAQSQQGNQSVVERLIAQNAATDARQAGLETLPVQEGTYAGGGIVAFAGGSEKPISSPVSFIGSLAGGNTVDPDTLRAYYIANGLPVPPELRKPTEPSFVNESGGEFIPFDQESMVQRDSAAKGIKKWWESVGKAPMFSEPTPEDRERGVKSLDELRAAAAKTKESMTPGGRTELEQGRVNSSPTSFADIIRYAQENKDKKDKTAEAKTTAEGAKPTAKPTAEGTPSAAKATKEAPSGPKSISDYIKEMRDAYAEAGYDADKVKKAEEERLAKQEAALKGQKYEDKWRAILTAGLGMLGGESEYGLTNIGKGALLGNEAYGRSDKEHRAAQKELDKARADMVKADQLEKKGMATEAVKLRDKAFDRAIEQQKADAATLSAQASMAQAKNPRDTSLQAAAVNAQVKLAELQVGALDTKLKLISLGQDPTYNELKKKDKTGKLAAEYRQKIETEMTNIMKRAQAVTPVYSGSSGNVSMPTQPSSVPSGFSAKEIK